MKNANTNPSHSFTEGADYDPTLHYAPKLVTPEYLLKKNFQKVNDTTYRLALKMDIFHPIVIQAECDHNSFVLSMTIGGCDRWTILPYETEFQLNKLINALQGK